jgi:hypothetical protein
MFDSDLDSLSDDDDEADNSACFGNNNVVKGAKVRDIVMMG